MVMAAGFLPEAGQIRPPTRPAPAWMEVTSEQHCDEPRSAFGGDGQSSDQVTEVEPGQRRPPAPVPDKSTETHPRG
ncbi:MAG: hypothetical protein WB777_14760, partial [Mycobacterium sp.]